MHVLHGVATVLLTLLGVSAGAVAAASGGTARPRIVEVGMTPAVAAAVLLLSGGVSRWLVLGLGVAAGFAASAIARRLAEWLGDGEAGRAIALAADDSDPAWRRFLLAVGSYQSRLVLILLYFTLVAPFALIGRLTQDPLGLREPGGDSHWRPRASDDDLSRPY